MQALILLVLLFGASASHAAKSVGIQLHHTLPKRVKMQVRKRSITNENSKVWRNIRWKTLLHALTLSVQSCLSLCRLVILQRPPLEQALHLPCR